MCLYVWLCVACTCSAEACLPVFLAAHRLVLAAGPILYKTYEAGYYALTAEVNITAGIPSCEPHSLLAPLACSPHDEPDPLPAADFATATLPLGNGSQVVVAADGATGIVMLGFSASDATLQLMTSPVTNLEPIPFLDNEFQDGPPAVRLLLSAGKTQSLLQS